MTRKREALRGKSREQIRKEIAGKIRSSTLLETNNIQKNFFYKKMSNISMDGLKYQNIYDMKRMRNMLRKGRDEGKLDGTIDMLTRQIKKHSANNMIDFVGYNDSNKDVELTCSKEDANCYLITVPEVYWTYFREDVLSNNILSLAQTLAFDYDSYKVGISHFVSQEGVQTVPVNYGIDQNTQTFFAQFSVNLDVGYHDYTEDEANGNFAVMILHTKKGQLFNADLSNARFTDHDTFVNISPPESQIITEPEPEVAEPEPEPEVAEPEPVNGIKLADGNYHFTFATNWPPVLFVTISGNTMNINNTWTYIYDETKKAYYDISYFVKVTGYDSATDEYTVTDELNSVGTAVATTAEPEPEP